MIGAGIDGIDPWARDADARLVLLRHHLRAMRNHEAAVASCMTAPRGELIWRLDRIEGHALRAIVAMLEAFA